MEDIGRTLIVFGIFIVIVGLVFLVAGRFPLLGHLPGDIRIQSGNVSCLIPLATSLLLSILLTIVLNLVGSLLNRH